MKWTTKKPKLTKECLLLTSIKLKDAPREYHLFEIIKVEFEGQWYFGIFTEDGDEWGDYEELNTSLYCILPLIKEK